MMHLYQKYIGLLLLLASGNVLAANTSWVLTEDALVEKVYHESTLLTRQQSYQAQTDSMNLEEISRFQPIWKSKIYYQDSNEKGLASFMPTFGPVYGFSTGVMQKFSHGLDVEANFFGDLTSTTDSFIDKATRTGVNVKAKIDLLKNFMGRIDQAKLKSSQLQIEKTEIQNHMDMRTFELEMRKHFWSLVSIEKKISVANKLLETANIQYEDSLKRQKNFIADVSDTQRYKAQVADRKSTLYTLTYQKDLILQQMKQFFPPLSNATIEMGDYNIEQTTMAVLACVEQIKSYPRTPWDHTQMDELLAVIEKDYAQQKKVDQSIAGADLALESKVQASGVDRGFADSYADFASDAGIGVQIGLVLDVPLGSSKKKAEKAKHRFHYEQFLADQKETKATVEAQQSQLTSMVDTLYASMQNYDENNETLLDNISRMQKKYKQARIDVLDLVREQDALSQNALSEIDAHLAIMHILLDYFKVFTEDPCSINQLYTQYVKKGA
ncbi:MAG: TolC family protein [Bdellovibrionota bacterium]